MIGIKPCKNIQGAHSLICKYDLFILHANYEQVKVQHIY